MATTTNYGWTTPDNTALVKDGASAIRTLGSSVDTTVKALSPGTTAGDVDYYTSSTAKARLGIGSTGQVLTVAAGVPSWATSSSGGMTLISTTTLTGATTTISSLPQTYNNLYFVIRNFRPSSNNNALAYYFNGDTASRYYAANGTEYASVSTTFNQTSISMGADTSSTTNTGMATLEINDYTNTVTWKIGQSVTTNSQGFTVTDFSRIVSGGIYNQTAAITSITFKSTGGNLTAGTVLLYGVK